MMTLALVAVGFLAYANGANDNFKGVATLFGSGTTNYRTALAWTTAATFAGSAASVVLAGPLVQRFSGKGLVPDSVAASPAFLLAVALGAGLTVLLATFTGFPISTTHGLTGTLLGAGVAVVGASVNLIVLRKTLPYFQHFSAGLLLLAGSYIVYYWLAEGQLAQVIF